MTAPTPNVRSQICWFCDLPGEDMVTHEGGEHHDGFHSECLEGWLHISEICPYDAMPLRPILRIPCSDLTFPRSQLSRVDRILARLRPALINAVYAASFGVTTSVLGMIGGRALRTNVLPTVVARVLRLRKKTEVVFVKDREDRAVIGLTRASLIAGPVLIGVGVRSMFNRMIRHRIIDPIDRARIRLGMNAGLVTGAVAAIFPTVIGFPTIVLIGGGTTFLISLFRG